MRFSSSQNIITVGLLWLTVLFLVITPFVTEETGITLYIAIGICCVVAALLIWMLLDTKYILRENKVHYYSGPIRGEIEVDSIHRIEHVTTWYVGTLLKPALGSKGITLHYNKFDDIYISPKEKEKFISELLKVNPKIKLV